MVRANKKIRAKLYITCRTNGHKTKLRQKPYIYIYRVYIEIVTSSIYVESVLKVYITSYSLLSRFCSFFPERLFFALMLLCLGEVAPIAFLVMFVNQRCRCFLWQPNYVQSEWWMWFWNRNWSHLSLPATLTCIATLMASIHGTTCITAHFSRSHTVSIETWHRVYMLKANKYNAPQNDIYVNILVRLMMQVIINKLS